MYLLIGDGSDLGCQLVGQSLAAGGHKWRMLGSPFTGGQRLAWRLDDQRSESQLRFDDGCELSEGDIAGVLVRNTGWIDAEGWQQDDLAYAHTETQAALLGWLWSLECPVIGRLPAAVWYRPQVAVTFWQPLLHRCGLRAPEAIVTNVEAEARAFGGRCAEAAVYAPFSSPSRYLLADESDWQGLAALQRVAPVCLVQPHAATQPVCVVGQSVIWDGEPPLAAPEIESGLMRFVAAAEMNFVEFALADTAGALSVVMIDAQPRLERFSDPCRRRITRRVVETLTGVASSSSATD